MKAVANFVPGKLENAIDLARNIATFGHFEFSPAYIRMRILDPAKVVFMDLILTPTTYRCEVDFTFGVNLHMFYKLLRTLHNDDEVEIEADESILKINQCMHFHTLVNQEIPLPPIKMIDFSGPKVTLPTKLLQKYVRALANVAAIAEINYVPQADTLFLESVNSMYRTLFSIDTGVTPNNDVQDEYRQQFVLKFLDSAILPSLKDRVDLTFSSALTLAYEHSYLNVMVVVSPHTEG